MGNGKNDYINPFVSSNIDLRTKIVNQKVNPYVPKKGVMVFKEWKPVEDEMFSEVNEVKEKRSEIPGYDWEDIEGLFEESEEIREEVLPESEVKTVEEELPELEEVVEEEEHLKSEAKEERLETSGYDWEDIEGLFEESEEIEEVLPESEVKTAEEELSESEEVVEEEEHLKSEAKEERLETSGYDWEDIEGLFEESEEIGEEVLPGSEVKTVEEEILESEEAVEEEVLPKQEVEVTVEVEAELEVELEKTPEKDDIERGLEGVESEPQEELNQKLSDDVISNIEKKICEEKDILVTEAIYEQLLETKSDVQEDIPEKEVVQSESPMTKGEVQLDKPKGNRIITAPIGGGFKCREEVIQPKKIAGKLFSKRRK